ncbi:MULTISPECIES: type II and III secretion system protein family protein [Microvirga]|uniref:type II and III secretion system protein family protein n=1 Tax=Microvirga TaxID=186650 RepID=UPI000E0D2514|nr:MULTISPECIES: type II and III secretion system protein family protein [Microvirga]MBQ0819189.1 type II and III secretion system protein family protein [Microvirga sp. HBU67558]
MLTTRDPDINRWPTLVDCLRAIGCPNLGPLLCTLLLLSPLSAVAQSNGDKGPRRATSGSINATLKLSSSLGKTVHLPASAATIFVADPTVADYQAPSNETIFVFGKKSGRTTLFALNDRGEALAELQIVVTEPIEDLRDMLRDQVGDYPIRVKYTPRGAILSGTAPDAETVDTAKRIAEQYLGEGAQVVNNIKVAGSLQVNLSVRVAEVSRGAMNELGINLSALGQIGNFKVGLLSGGNRAGSGTGKGGGTAEIGYNDGNINISAVLDALAKENIASILAEPNLTAISGETARFLVGGEFPIPVPRENGQVSIEFRHFGVSLEFLPTVLDNKQINIRVKPEVSDLTSQGAIQINGISVPAISTRRADTVVELASGQSFAIGGLIRRTTSNNISAFPGLGQVPILGALFRSSSFQKEESELVILVTPYIVRPGSSPVQMSAPTDRMGSRSDGGEAKSGSPTRPRGRVTVRTGVPGAKSGVGYIIE